MNYVVNPKNGCYFYKGIEEDVKRFLIYDLEAVTIGRLLRS